MSRELDRRDFSVNKVTPTRECELHTMASDVSASLPGSHRVQIARFGRHRQTQRDLLESAPAERGNYIQRALDHCGTSAWRWEDVPYFKVLCLYD